MNHLPKDYDELCQKDRTFFAGVATKELLDGYRKLIVLRGRTWYNEECGYRTKEDVKIIETLCETIKAVLDTREHIPNKKERKGMRQRAAKRKK